MRFREIRKVVKNTIMKAFFDDQFLEDYLERRLPLLIADSMMMGDKNNTDHARKDEENDPLLATTTTTSGTEENAPGTTTTPTSSDTTSKTKTKKKQLHFIDSVLERPDFDERMKAKLEAVSQTPEGAMLLMMKTMFGGSFDSLIPMVKPTLAALGKDMIAEFDVYYMQYEYN